MPRSTKTWQQKAPLWRGFFIALGLLLGGCASAPTPPLPPLVSAAEPRLLALEPAAEDAQTCLSRSECSLKLARTLLFVFAYAEAGAPLLERSAAQQLRTPEPGDGPWPALVIDWSGPEVGRFELSAHCLPGCRVGPSQVLEAYRLYLVGERCVWHQGRCQGLGKTP